jgi:hypothetical protein
MFKIRIISGGESGSARHIGFQDRDRRKILSPSPKSIPVRPEGFWSCYLDWVLYIPFQNDKKNRWRLTGPPLGIGVSQFTLGIRGLKDNWLIVIKAEIELAAPKLLNEGD